MTVVSTREFRANQTKYFALVDKGEYVVVRSRHGRYRIMPDDDDAEEPGRDVTAEVCQGLRDFRAYLDGDKTRMKSAYDLLDELRNSND